MVEYRYSAHTIWDIDYHLVWITRYRYKVLRGEVAERTRDLMSSARGGDHSRRGVARSHSSTGVSPVADCAGESGAICQREIVAPVTKGVPAPAQTVLGPASVGTQLLLRDRGCGR